MKTLLHYSESGVHITFWSPLRLRALVLFLCMLGSAFEAGAQNKIWDKTLGTEYVFYQDPDDENNFYELGDEDLTALVATPDGGYLLGGSSDSDISGDKTQPSRGSNDFWLIKTNSKGAKVWDRTFGGSGPDELLAMTLSSAGGYLIGGNTRSDKGGDKSQEEEGLWIVRIDENGNKLWDKVVTNSLSSVVRAIVATPDGGYLLSCTYNGSSGDKRQDAQGKRDYQIIKIDAKGSKAWDRVYGGGADDELEQVVISPDGGYLLGGTSVSGAGGNKSEASRGVEDYWVVKIDDKGDKVWDKTFGGSSGDYLAALVATPDGYLLGGNSASGVGQDKSDAKRGETDFWVVKIDKDGSKIWDKTYGVFDNDYVYEYLQSITATPDGGFLLGGYSNAGISGDKTEPNRSTYTTQDYWVIKVDINGNKIWDKTLGGDEGDLLSTVVISSDGGYVLGGISNSGISGDKSEANIGSIDYWLVKIEDIGKMGQSISFAQISDRILGDAPFLLDAQTSSGLPITYHIVSGPAMLSGNTLTVTGADTIIVKASQAGNDAFNPALDVIRTFTVKRILLPEQWSKRLGANKRDALAAMVQTPDGGYLLAGSSNSDESGDKTDKRRPYAEDCDADYWVVKVDANGNKIWDKTFGGNRNDGLSSIIATPDGNYLLGGTSASHKSGDRSEESRNEYADDLYSGDYWVVKISPEGEKIWDKTFGGNFDDQLNIIVAAPGGGFLLAGNSNSDISGDKTEPSRGSYMDDDFWVVQIDEMGNKVWDKTFGGTSYDWLSSSVATPDGNFLLGGYSYSGAGHDKTEPSRGSTDYWIVKIDGQGTKIWDKALGGNDEDRLSAMAVAPDGGYLLGGSSSGAGGDKSDTESGSAWLADVWLVKINEDGNKVWDKSVVDFQLKDIVLTPDGDYLLGGEKRYRLLNESREEIDFSVVKMNSQGIKIGEMAFGEAGKSEGISVIILTGDGGCLLGGYSAKFIGSSEEAESESQLYADFYIVKTSIEFSPFIKSFSPERGLPQQEVSISGKNLLSTTGVRFNGAEAKFIIANDTLVKAVVPALAISGKISLETLGGIVTTTQRFTISNSEPATAWNLRYGGAATDRFAVVINTSDGGYLSGGYSNSGSSGDKTQASKGGADYWVVKTDQNGIRQWDKTYGGTSHDYLNRIIQTKDGGYLLAGSSTSGAGGDKSQGSRGNQDYWIIKISSNGAQEWDRTYGGSGFDDLRKVNQLPDGGYLLAGTSNSPLSGDKSMNSQGGQDYWVIRISATGDKLWDKRYGGSADEHLESFNKTSDGSFVLAGSSASGKSGDKTQASKGNNDYWLVKIDANGVKLWDKSYGGNGADELYSIGYTSQDEFFVAGHSSSGKSGDRSQASQGASDYWMLKLDKQGEKLWDKSFGGSGREELRSIIQAPDGGYVLAGSSDSPISGDKTESSRGGMDYWLVKTDAHGNKEYDQRFGGAGEEEFRYIQRTADGGYLLGGRSDSGASGDRTQPSQGGVDYWLVKVAPRENTTTPAALAGTPARPESGLKSLRLSAYPNPATERVTASFSLEQTQQVTLAVYDSQGRKTATVYEGEAKAGQLYEATWQPTGNQKDGMYVVRLRTAGEIIYQKIILAR